jgi:hypothetical protein
VPAVIPFSTGKGGVIFEAFRGNVETTSLLLLESSDAAFGFVDSCGAHMTSDAE